MPSSKTHLPRGLRFPVPLDKGNEGSGDEIVADMALVHVIRNVNYSNCVHRMFHLVFCVTPIVTTFTAFSAPIVTFDERMR